jgi:putative peptidoglycan lipid II flippase
MLPHSLVAVSLVTALFTRMSGAAREGDWPRVRDDLSLGLRSVGVFTMPAAALLVALAVPVGVAMAQNGSLPAGRAVGSVAAAMAVGLPAFSATYLVQRVFYAYEDARTLLFVAVPATAVVVAADVLSLALLPPRWVVVGVGAGMSASALLSVVLSVALLRRRHGHLQGHAVVRTYVRLLLASLAAGGAAYGTSLPLTGLTGQGRLGAIATCAAAGTVAALVYLVALKVLRVAELDVAVAQVRRRLRR